jgi:hypothetical protein
MWVYLITVARVLNGVGTLREIVRTLIWGSHRPLHRVANVTSLVAYGETGFKFLTSKDLLESSKVSRQPIGERDKEFKE